MYNINWRSLENITGFANACGVHDPIRPLILPRGYYNTLYLVLLFNLNENGLPNEVFLKIGSTGNLEQRLSALRTNSRCKTLLIGTSRFEGGMNLEEHLKKSLEKYRYAPSQPFCGETECFDPDIIRNPLIMAIFELCGSDINIFLNYIYKFNKTEREYAFL